MALAFRFLLVLSLAVAVLSGCSRFSAHDAVRLAQNPTEAAARAILVREAAKAARDPVGFARDFQKLIELFRRAVAGRWGEDEVELPRPKRYVKYTENYASRALVDFAAGRVTVETIDQDQPLSSLREAVVVTLLTPSDPRAVDLYSDEPVELGAEPYLYGQVRDYEGKFVRWQWRAERFADALIERGLSRRTVREAGTEKTVHSVSFSMVPDHLEKRAARYRGFVEESAARFGVEPGLVFAIMRTESSFNPFAVSHAGAFGLMQVVPETAGADVYRLLHGKRGAPTPDELLDPAVNIRYGAGYLHLLFYRYLDGVPDSVSLEYMAVAAYNGGPGSVLRTFADSPQAAKRRAGELGPAGVWKKLTQDHPFAETRRYLEKVTEARRDFVAP